MPWYKIFANHGPGHQTHSEFYEYAEKKLDEEDRKALWNERFDKYEYDWPIGDAVLLHGIPSRIRKAKIDNCRSRIKHLRNFLKVLKVTPVDDTEVEKERIEKQKRFRNSLQPVTQARKKKST